MANLAPIIPALFTGPNGERLTPDQIKRRQELAQSLLARATDTSPNAGGWTSVLAKGVQGFASGWNENRGERAAAQNAKESQGNIQAMLSALTGSPAVTPSIAPSSVGQMDTVATPVVGETQNISVPATANAQAIRQGLIDRGLPEHIADGFLVNFKDESGLNPGINEAKPLVPGSRGGFGLYQLTGPRRVAYEQFAQQRGVPAADVNAQLDFLMTELQGPEKAAAASIFKAGDTASAAQAIVNNFLRPAPEHREARAARYAGLSGSTAPAAQPMQTATPTAPQMNPMAIQALSSPYASDQERAVAQALLGQYTSQQEKAQALALKQQQQQQEIQRRQQIAQQNGINPTFALDDELWKGATSNLFAAPSTSTIGNTVIDNRTGQPIYQGAPERQPLMNLGDGTVYDPNAPADQRFIQAPNSNRNFRQATPDEIKVYGTNGQVGPDGRFYPVAPPQGTALSVDPTTGAVTFNQGPGVKPLTEAQSKDSFFATRMTSAVPTIDKYQSSLLNLPEAAAGAVPGGRYLQSEEYQLARDAGDDFVAAYLRKDSGAALTEEEKTQYSNLLLPRPGDKPAIIEAKKRRREVAIRAIESGMPPSAVDGVLKAIQAVDGADKPAPLTENPLPEQPNQPKKRLKFNPATGMLE